MSSKLESDVCCRLQVAPSGESYGSNGSILPDLWRDSLHVTCGLTAGTPGSAPGPTLGKLPVWENFTFLYSVCVCVCVKEVVQCRSARASLV